MSLTVIDHETPEEMYERAAREFIVLFEQTILVKPQFAVALSGGQTAKAFFGFLLNQLMGKEQLARLQFFFSDERALPLDDPESNAGNAERLLLNPLSLDRSQLWPMFDGISAPDLCARQYESHIKQQVASNAQGVPVFDLIYLGIGQDGHTASLFPHNEILRDVHSLVRSTTVDAAPHERITMMPRLINAASNIHVLAHGHNKAHILQEIINGPVMPETLPAQLILRYDASAVTLLTAH